MTARERRENGHVERLSENSADHERHDRGDEVEIRLRGGAEERGDKEDLAQSAEPLEHAARKRHGADEGCGTPREAPGTARRRHAGDCNVSGAVRCGS